MLYSLEWEMILPGNIKKISELTSFELKESQHLCSSHTFPLDLSQHQHSAKHSEIEDPKPTWDNYSIKTFL